MGLRIGSFLGRIASNLPGPAGYIGRAAVMITRRQNPSPIAIPGLTPQGPVFGGGLPLPSFNLFPGQGGTGLIPFNPGQPGRFPTGGGGTLTSPGGTQVQVPKGYHVNKLLVRASVYAQNHGGNVPPGMQRRIAGIVNTIVKNRSMDVCNVRALRRASHRAHGFIKLTRHLVGYYQPKKPKGRAFIKRKR